MRQPSNAQLPAGAGAGNAQSGDHSVLNTSSRAGLDGTFSDMFDYASFMWDDGVQSGNLQPTRWRDVGYADMEGLNQGNNTVNTTLLLNASWEEMCSLDKC